MIIKNKIIIIMAKTSLIINYLKAQIVLITVRIALINVVSSTKKEGL